MNNIKKYLDCNHEWAYSSTTPFIQVFLQKNRHCKKCNFIDCGFGFTEEEIMEKFKKDDKK